MKKFYCDNNNCPYWHWKGGVCTLINEGRNPYTDCPDELVNGYFDSEEK